MNRNNSISTDFTILTDGSSIIFEDSSAEKQTRQDNRARQTLPSTGTIVQACFQKESAQDKTGLAIGSNKADQVVITKIVPNSIVFQQAQELQPGMQLLSINGVTLTTVTDGVSPLQKAAQLLMGASGNIMVVALVPPTMRRQRRLGGGNHKVYKVLKWGLCLRDATNSQGKPIVVIHRLEYHAATHKELSAGMIIRRINSGTCAHMNASKIAKLLEDQRGGQCKITVEKPATGKTTNVVLGHRDTHNFRFRTSNWHRYF
ncbi:expressed unknown protein [Seminavis robusta]|uniref:PDZ domain-containing protein n=1 Tax=Seminavis robusta TaxID=568900 RepID=A0A9N8DXL5_9STRA|nr:expressed unknown protein [Seminavis robusta]|eukprot:Sro371_g128540.1 n/a (260) ;mRNA; r:18592-19371